MAGVAASEARSFEQWQATLDDRIAATVALGVKRFPEGLSKTTRSSKTMIMRTLLLGGAPF